MAALGRLKTVGRRIVANLGKVQDLISFGEGLLPKANAVEAVHRAAATKHKHLWQALGRNIGEDGELRVDSFGSEWTSATTRQHSQRIVVGRIAGREALRSQIDRPHRDAGAATAHDALSDGFLARFQSAADAHLAGAGFERR